LSNKTGEVVVLEEQRDDFRSELVGVFHNKSFTIIRPNKEKANAR
jgi:hypothetical protein